MRRTVVVLFLLCFSLYGHSQSKQQINFNLGIGNTWYDFNPDRLKSIFIQSYDPGMHTCDLAHVSLEFEYNRRLMNRVWLSNAAGPLLSRLEYTDQNKKSFSTSELFLTLRSGLRFYSNEFISPLIFLELQPGIAYSLSGGSSGTDYVKGDFYKPGQLLPFYQAGIGARRIILFYRQYRQRGIAADKLRSLGLMLSIGS